MEISVEEKIKKMDDFILPRIEALETFITYSGGNFAFNLSACSFSDMVQALIILHQYYQDFLPSRETALIITKLEEAWLIIKTGEQLEESWSHGWERFLREDAEAIFCTLKELPGMVVEDGNMLVIQLQVGHPGQEGSIPGCFPKHMIRAIFVLIQEFLQNQCGARFFFPKTADHTYMKPKDALAKLEEAWLWSKKRELDRKQRGVLQTDKS